MKKIINTVSLITICILLAFSKSVTASKYVIKMRKDLNVNISVDKIKPDVNIIDINGSIIDEKNNQAIKQVKIEYTDNLSGIDYSIYKYNPYEENFNECEAKELVNDVTFTEEGWYYIEITDKAGNSSIYHFLICTE